MYWPRLSNKLGCRRKSSWRGYPENSLQPSINIRPTAVSPPNTYPKEYDMGILWTIIIGFVAGVIAKFIMPGDNEPTGFILTAILGIVGAFVATFLGKRWLVSARGRCRADRCRGWRRCRVGCLWHGCRTSTRDLSECVGPRRCSFTGATASVLRKRSNAHAECFWTRSERHFGSSNQ